jgi:hypothetical protein
MGGAPPIAQDPRRVIPAQAGIQGALGPRLRGDDARCQTFDLPSGSSFFLSLPSM